MKRILILSAGLILIVTAPVFALCHLDWLTNPEGLRDFPSIGENMHLIKESAAVDHNGNIHFITISLGNALHVDDKEEICWWNIEWEVCCERREVRALRARTRHHDVWPLNIDYTIQLEKIWKSYNDSSPIGKACNEFCGRKNQLQRLSPGDNLKIEKY